ncbi:MAG: hypothetical protein IKU02_07230 [Bacteroidaceae bacterium]|nr:hypothetical protein [Bacteroidaceae bacterium]
MNKYIYASMILCLYAGALKAQKTICLQTKAETNGVGKTIPARDVEETPNGVKITYCFNNIITQDDPLYNNASMVKIEGFWPNSNVGEPSVLSRWDTFVVPNTDVEVVISDSSYVEFPMELSPARPLLSNSEDESYTREIVIPIVGYRGLFPTSFISATRNDSYRGQPLLDVCVTPVQYDFDNKKVRVFTMIQYNIQYNVTSLTKSLSRYLKERKSGDSFLDNIALNIPSRELAHSPRDVSSTDSISNKYLIVSVPKYTSAVNEFAKWKRKLGFDVRIEMRESWDTTMVKNVVRNAYQTDSIKYLLIFGGSNDVPGITRSLFFNNKYYEHDTDLYYGCMDTCGYTPDIFRGRIPVSTSNAALTVVDKIINYEKNPPIDVGDERFYRTGVHCAYFQDVSPNDSCEDRRFVLTSERVRDSMLRDTTLCHVDSITRVYFTEGSATPKYWNPDTYANREEITPELQRPTFSWNGNSADIINCINQKAFYVLMRDHGAVDSWVKPSFDTGNIDQLNNGNYLPVVFSICCHTGEYASPTCFCKHFLDKSSGGCVAIYGASDKSLSGANDVLAEGMFDAIWPSLNLRPLFGHMGNIPSYSPTPTPTFRLGQILDQGLRRCDEAYLRSTRPLYSQHTSEVFHCFGDPSMMIYTEQPQPFTNVTIDRLDNGIISVNTGGILATISFYNTITDEVWSCVGYSASHPGDLDTSVCISAHNMIPLIVEVPDMLYIQNDTLTNGGRYEAKTIKVGNHVTTPPHGNVTFSQGNYYLVGKQVELHPGTKVSVGTKLRIKNR